MKGQSTKGFDFSPSRWTTSREASNAGDPSD
jgi:hypothetical protein